VDWVGYGSHAELTSGGSIDEISSGKKIRQPQNKVDVVETVRVGRVGFTDAVRFGIKRWNDFSGRSTRAEFWWFYLFLALVIQVISIPFQMAKASAEAILSFGVGDFTFWIVTLPLLLPYYAVGARRLHDINRTGWWQLLHLLPLLAGALVAAVGFGAGGLELDNLKDFWILILIGVITVGITSFTLLYWYGKSGDAESNRFGPRP
jgi:uncharacterized membrane protein YhaH (DUF805 family)